ncbi:5-dehydro-4-deoxyglucarate dehydratase [Myceligenerans pegani]|uniref:5-dehydro-4-deoxyglucarate dehydratase n=1 Tax=Myceligenerans pegani TaxID=2776917 RepID=UPI00299D783D|nr:5-dehydro-4-deoxyglucarate dehydratase [Myceligenerans sp. TRM 65318]
MSRSVPADDGLLPPLTRALFFPVTPFDEHDRVDEDVLARHVADGVEAGAGATFVACGTGEFHALSVDEYRTVVRAGIDAARRTRRVGRLTAAVAGVGGPVGHARQCARLAQDAGAEALLVMPPYLVAAPQSGIVRYVEAVAEATDLPLIAYHRANARLTEESVLRLLDSPQVAGIKDGVGDVALMQRFVLAARRLGRDDVQFFNGLLTAESSQLAYRAIGVPLYSSATFAMAPTIANAFYDAYMTDDATTQQELLDGFFTPLVRLRDETPGFAVSLIKAGLRLRGMPVGSVRAPLVDPSPAQAAALARILARGEEIAA